MATIRVSAETLQKLVTYAGKEQIVNGKRVSMDTAIQKLLVQKNGNIQFLNDTTEDITVRINLMNAQPRAVTVKPQKMIAIFPKSTDVLVKVWDNNVVLFQDITK